ncbi:MAG: septal ring lytic transglycosylase RlpA family protein [Herminiimonas sp.]|nr:septal ring lytic transglycosylase RlpA family protein [Herminiimonas sp.]
MPLSATRLLGIALIVGWSVCAVALAETGREGEHSAHAVSVASKRPLDHSGKPRTGKASYYAARLHGRKTADGSRMNLNSNMAASRTLPFGTWVRVTNLRNGRSATVQIRDRGPYVRDRIIDVMPRVADQLGFRRAGVAPVVVRPLRMPRKSAVKDLAGIQSGTGRQRRPG